MNFFRNSKRGSAEKAELRRIFVEKRRELSPEEREAASRQIANNFFDNFDLNGIRYLHCFISIDKFNEIDTGLIFKRLWDEFSEVATVVPRVNYARDELESVVYSRETPLAEKRWNIKEPLHDQTVPAEAIDIVLVPLLCIDRSGHRVGYGKGYYDRFLTRCRPDCLKIGLSYFEAVDEISDTHGGDVRLDFFITPAGIHSVSA